MLDLLALARLRSLLLELGYTMRPGEGGVDVLETWMRMPSGDLGGRVPMELLASGDDSDRQAVADALKMMISAGQAGQ